MKTQIRFLSYLIFVIFTSQSFSQSVIWQEEFTYPDGTTQGPGNPPKWITETAPNTDWFEVRDNAMEGKDLDGECVWTSETISISGFSLVDISVDLFEEGPLENSDYIGVYYILDGGSETEFEVNGFINNDFTAAVATQSSLSGSTLVLKVRVNNNGNIEVHHFDNIVVTQHKEGDFCSNAIVVSEVNDLPFTTTDASASGQNPGCGGNQDPVDIWYEYTPSADGIASVSLCGSNYDTRLAVWSACGGSPLVCNDDSDICGSGSLQSYISGNVNAGTTYYIQVGGYNDDTGDGFITIALTQPPVNDNCASAIPVNEVTDLPFSTINATASGQNPGCGGGQDPVDLWYAYTPVQSGIVSIDLCGSEFDTRLAVWDGCGGNVLLCNDNDWYCGFLSQTSYVTGQVNAGQTYYIQVGGDGNDVGTGDLTISLIPFPSNDDCSNAIAIGEVENLPFTTIGATAGGDNPGCGGNQDPVDIWYTYTPPEAGIVSIDLCGSEFDTRLAVWDGCGGNVLACNDDDNFCGFFSETSYISGPVQPGTTYYIQIGGRNTNTGVGDITLTFYPYPENDECANATVVGEVTDLAFTTIGATAGGDNPGCGGNQDPVDIWYAYTPGQSGEVTIDLCGSGFDTRLAVWDACSGNVIYCNDNDSYCGFFAQTSYITGPVTGGVTYYIQVGGNNSSTGTGDITIALYPYPTNDDCSNAIPTSEVNDLAFTTNGATAGGDNPGCGGGQDPVDIWYAYTPSGSGIATIDLEGSSFDTRLAVWDACGGAVLACNDNAGIFNETSSLDLNVTSGNTYYVQVGGNNSATGTGDLSIFLDIPSNNVIWTGVVSNDWNLGNNWQVGYIPLAISNVTIPSSPAGGNYPETNSGPGAECNNLVVQNGATIEIPSTNTLTVNGDLGNNAGTNGLILKSDANGAGSLLHSTDNVNATVEQYLISERWHMVSPPVSNAQIGSYMSIYLKEYNEPVDDWTYLVDPVTLPLNAAQGYAAWASDELTGTKKIYFNGPLNNGDYPLSLSYTASSPNAGWNLVGNPFPSALQWNSSWTKTDVGDWACVHFDGNDQCYNAATATGWPNPGDMADGIIPATQGFWVRATSASATITIPQSERLHSSQPFYKTTKNEVLQSVRLRVDGNDDFDVVLFQFIGDATHGFDASYDLEKRWGYAESPNVYSMVQADKPFSVDARPVPEENMVYPIGLEIGANGIYTFEVTEFTGFTSEYDVILEDLLENEFITLSENTTYTFAGNIENEAHRFNLIIEKGSSDVSETVRKAVSIYSFDNSVYVKSSKENIHQIIIYDILGHEIKRLENGSADILKIPVNKGTGYYIVKVQTQENLYTEKVLIK